VTAVAAAPAELPTRERILFEASRLFARQGFHATTTRQIADAVGVRQPSLFHHFASKDTIMQTLLAWDLDLALPALRRLAASTEPASLRLYRYVRDDVEHLATAPYNLTGLYTEEVMGDPAFAPWSAKLDRLHTRIQRIIADGISSGEFVPMSAGLAREAITGLLVRTLTVYSGGRASSSELGDQVATFALRALLADPTRIDSVRSSAVRS